MCLQAEPLGLVIGHHLFRQGHGWQTGQRGFRPLIPRSHGGEQRQIGRGDQAAGIPQRLPPGQPERVEAVRRRQPLDQCRGKPGALLQFTDITERPLFPRRHDPRGGSFGKAIDLAQAKAQGGRSPLLFRGGGWGWCKPPKVALRAQLALRHHPCPSSKEERNSSLAPFACLQRIIPPAGIHIDRQHRHPMLPGIADDLGRGVKAHRLRIEQRTGEGRRVMALQPRRDIDQQGKAGGVAFRKAIFAKALDLAEAASGKVRIIAARHHPPDHQVFQFMHHAAAAERRHRLAQPVGLKAGKLGGIERDLHRLFLKDRHPQRTAEDGG